MSRKIADRRAQRRLHLAGEVIARAKPWGAKTFSDVFVEDITATGIQVSGCEKLKVGTRVEIELAGTLVHVDVVWCRKHYRYPDLYCFAGKLAGKDKEKNLIDVMIPVDEVETSDPAIPILDLEITSTGTD